MAWKVETENSGNQCPEWQKVSKGWHENMTRGRTTGRQILTHSIILARIVRFFTLQSFFLSLSQTFLRDYLNDLYHFRIFPTSTVNHWYNFEWPHINASLFKPFSKPWVKSLQWNWQNTVMLHKVNGRPDQ